MLKVTIEELTALNLILQFVSVAELLDAAMKGFTESEETLNQQEKSDLCWKILKTLK